MALTPYDALLLLSFGGPEGPDDVVPFLENVTRGRGIPAERLREVGTHYFARGGVSPINDENRALIAALTDELGRRGHDLPIWWGNRNWRPTLDEALDQARAAGHQRLLVLTTSAYPGYSSCRQYLEDLAGAFAGDEAPDLQLDRVRQYAHLPGFIQANVDAVCEAYAQTGDGAHLAFVTHSIPVAASQTSGPQPRSARGSYLEWHDVIADAVRQRVEARLGHEVSWSLAFCSRSGPAHQAWLEPDINDHLTELAGRGVRAVVVSPIGFTSDHMEVVHDLDTEAAATAASLGLRYARAATARTHPAFVSGLVDLIEERAAIARGETVAPQVIAGGSPGLTTCPLDCCPPPMRPGRPA